MRKTYIMQLKKILHSATNKIEEFVNLKKEVDELYESLNQAQIENVQLKQKIKELSNIIEEERKIANENVVIYNKKFEQITNDMSIMVAALKELYINVEYVISSNNYSSGTFSDLGWGSNSDDDEEGH